ncbi:MAG: hypothetical protein HY666_00825 [Chloroflexi bacterium]|nr:hypothetical protein [Chloroflexota bacterium]
MEKSSAPNYAVFDDYRSSQGIAVVVRWFMLATWLTLINIRSQEPNLPYLNTMGAALIILNGYVHWRIWRGRPITWPYVLALSLMDLTIITAGIMVTSRFGNTYYIFYYPALLGVALIFRRRVSFAIVTIIAGFYAGISLTMKPGLDTSVLFDGDEKELTVRVVCMFAVVVAANLMTRLERQRRAEAVEAERIRMEENLLLQRRAEEAEREAQEERIRISQEIHDGAAQSAYMLSLGLETCCHMAGQEAPQLHDRLKALHAESKQALLELRYPINLGPLFEGRGLTQILADHLTNFRAITSIPTHFSMTGQETELPLATQQRLFALAHNALTNAYKYAQATEVNVELVCDDKTLKLSISDNGVGMDTTALAASSGHGIRNMRRTAEEMGGALDITSAPGKGTIVSVALSLSGGAP